MRPKSGVAWLVWLSVVVALLGWWTWYMSRPVPNWYISPPLDAQGRRARVLVPSGWEMDTHASQMPRGVLLAGQRVTIVFQSHESILSRWFRRLLGGPAEDPSKLYVDVGRGLKLLGMNPANPADGIEVTMGPNPWTGPVYLGYRVIKAGKPPIYGVVAFTSPNKRTFDNAHATICNSFRIE